MAKFNNGEVTCDSNSLFSDVDDRFCHAFIQTGVEEIGCRARIEITIIGPPSPPCEPRSSQCSPRAYARRTSTAFHVR